MKGFLEQCVERYTCLAGGLYKAGLKRAETPFVDESGQEFCDKIVDRGVLGDVASAILMKILYAGRRGRYDLLRPVAALASRVSKWTPACDKALHRLVCYINSSLETALYAWVGDEPKDLELVCYTDADLASDKNDSKSTTGVFLCLVGPKSFVPLSAVSKKQTSVSKSTPEAEIVALDHGLCKEGLPALKIWELILNRTLKIKVQEDNQAAVRIICTGKNPSYEAHVSNPARRYSLAQREIQ